VPYVAAGAPWFLSLFGRDSLVAALMAGLDGVWSAEGSLVALGRRQGRRRDDFRDEEPGKIPHELRRDAEHQTELHTSRRERLDREIIVQRAAYPSSQAERKRALVDVADRVAQRRILELPMRAAMPRSPLPEQSPAAAVHVDLVCRDDPRVGDEEALQLLRRDAARQIAHERRIVAEEHERRLAGAHIGHRGGT
jgi:hypothetical protein